MKLLIIMKKMEIQLKISSETNENVLNINFPNEPKLSNNIQSIQTNTNESNNKNLIKEQIFNYFILFSKYNDLKNLCSKIPSILENIKLDKKSLDDYYKVLFENLENKILIKKLSSTILLLQTSNLANIKRKLTEVIPFNIMEKYKQLFFFSDDYYPNKSNLNELKILMDEKSKKSEQNKEHINDDLKKLNEFIDKKDIKSSVDCRIYVNDNDKKGKQIRMVMDF